MSLLAVNHHYYREASPLGGIYPIDHARLYSEVESLRRNFRPLDQLGLLAALEDQWEIHSPKESFILTFDDGLKEQMKALHDLAALGVSPLFFVPTAPLVNHRVLDVHKLHLIRAARSDAELLKDLEKVFPVALKNFDNVAASAQYRYDDNSARQVKFLLNFILLPDERRDWIDKVFAAVVGSEVDVVKDLYMDREDICYLGKRYMLGTHSHSHLPLAQLNHEEIIQDISLSLDILTEIVKEKVNGISFPFGGPAAVSDSVVDACLSLGLTYGFTMLRGCNDISDLKAPLRLKRIDCNDIANFT